MKWGAIAGGLLAALVSFSASLSASMPARAADMTPVGPRAVPATSGYIPVQFFWTGFYTGVGMGGGWGSAPFTDPFGPAMATPSLRGLLVSGITGINYQISSIVVGVEGDFTGSWAQGSAVDSVADNLNASVFWTASITGRLGVAIDRLLIYGKGGVGFDYERDTVSGAAALGVAQGAFYRSGWTGGGGVEYAITDHWTGRLEYDYFSFPGKSVPISGSTVPPNAGAAVGITLSEFKGIASYKF